jgi:cytochrome c peroxidase
MILTNTAQSLEWLTSLEKLEYAKDFLKAYREEMYGDRCDKAEISRAVTTLEKIIAEYQEALSQQS